MGRWRNFWLGWSIRKSWITNNSKSFQTRSRRQERRGSAAFITCGIRPKKPRPGPCGLGRIAAVPDQESSVTFSDMDSSIALRCDHAGADTVDEDRDCQYAARRGFLDTCNRVSPLPSSSRRDGCCVAFAILRMDRACPDALRTRRRGVSVSAYVGGRAKPPSPEGGGPAEGVLDTRQRRPCQQGPGDSRDVRFDHPSSCRLDRMERLQAGSRACARAVSCSPP